MQISPQVKNAAILGAMQFLSWSICTISWRSVAQANYLASVITDTTFATVNFFLIKRIAKDKDDATFTSWLGYTVGGVLGTLFGIYSSIYLLGK